MSDLGNIYAEAETAEPKDDAAPDTMPAAHADIQLDEVDERPDIERPSSDAKLSSIFSDSSGQSDYNVLSPPFRPRPVVDFAATQSLACQRILQSSGYDTTHLQHMETVADTPRPKKKRAPMHRRRCDSPESTTETPKARQRGRRRSSDTVENKINFSEQVKEVVYANHWTESSLGLVETWFNKCERAAEQHAAAAVAARGMHVKVAFPSIVLGAAATSLAFFSVGDECDESDQIQASAISISLAVLTSAFSVLGGMSSLFALSERMSLHTAAAANFLSLARKIQLVLFLPMDVRNPVEVSLSDISGEYLSLIQNSPIIYNGF